MGVFKKLEYDMYDGHKLMGEILFGYFCVYIIRSMLWTLDRIVFR